MNSEESVALITGAGRGIGRAIALRLSDAGYAVVLVARTSEEITELRNEIISRGRIAGDVRSAYATPCDITIASEVNALRDDIESELGPLSILVNNAGVAPSSKFGDTTDVMWRDTFAVNVDGAFYMTRAFLPGLIQRSSRTDVISIGSTASLEGFRYTAAYTASKHALLGMMRALAKEYEKSPVIFSTICPGFTRTQILAEAVRARVAHGASSEKAEAMFAMMNRDGRIIEPEEVAETVLTIIGSEDLASGRAYFASDGSLESAD